MVCLRPTDPGRGRAVSVRRPRKGLLVASAGHLDTGKGPGCQLRCHKRCHNSGAALQPTCLQETIPSERGLISESGSVCAKRGGPALSCLDYGIRSCAPCAEGEGRRHSALRGPRAQEHKRWRRRESRAHHQPQGFWDPGVCRRQASGGRDAQGEASPCLPTEAVRRVLQQDTLLVPCLATAPNLRGPGLCLAPQISAPAKTVPQQLSSIPQEMEEHVLSSLAQMQRSSPALD